MNPLSALYGAVIRGRNARYDSGVRAARRLQGPVVSIGNIAVGGSGKTPFLIMLGRLLKQRGVSFDVLSRGYGRGTKGVALVDPAGSPRDFGDEPLLIAQKLAVPVIVGEDRYTAGLYAEDKFGPQLHLLDDGFQHRGLARDFDIVLITPGDAQDSLLPVGRLREPLSSLARADAVVLTNDTTSHGLPIAGQQVWHVRRGISVPQAAGECLAFCGIARPQNFFAQLRAAGITLSATRNFGDHHTYTARDVRQLLALRSRLATAKPARAGHVEAPFLTTEKDAINLGPELETLAPVHVVPVEMHLDSAEAVIGTLLSVIQQRNRGPA